MPKQNISTQGGREGEAYRRRFLFRVMIRFSQAIETDRVREKCNQFRHFRLDGVVLLSRERCAGTNCRESSSAVHGPPNPWRSVLSGTLASLSTNHLK